MDGGHFHLRQLKEYGGGPRPQVEFLQLYDNDDNLVNELAVDADQFQQRQLKVYGGGQCPAEMFYARDDVLTGVQVRTPSQIYYKKAP